MLPVLRKAPGKTSILANASLLIHGYHQIDLRLGHFKSPDTYIFPLWSSQIFLVVCKNVSSDFPGTRKTRASTCKLVNSAENPQHQGGWAVLHQENVTHPFTANIQFQEPVCQFVLLSVAWWGKGSLAEGILAPETAVACERPLQIATDTQQLPASALAYLPSIMDLLHRLSPSQSDQLMMTTT